MKRAAAAFVLLAAASASAAELRIQNSNAANEGFNDPTTATPAGINFGTTKGAQSVIAFQFAAAIWGAVLKSTVPTLIDAAFVTPAQDPGTTCNATSGLLGYTSPLGFATSPAFPNPQAGYVSALANSLAGRDLTTPAGSPHIKTRFNAGIGTAGCLSGISWYYGLDGVAPAGQVSLLATLLHEFSHGLGFTSFVDPTTGNLSGTAASYDFHVFDEVGQLTWANYTAAQRAPLLTAGNKLAFTGNDVAGGIGTFLGPTPILSFTGSGSATQSNYVAGQFSGPIPDGGAFPITAANPLDACADLPPGSLTGSVGLIERGTCNFYDKAQRAVAAGAEGVIVFDNDAGPLVQMASPDGGAALNVPAVFITNQDGSGVDGRLAGGAVTANFGFSSQISNTDATQQRVLLYTPSTASSGSTLSHWNAGSFPHALLMEPFIGVSSQVNLDLTPAALADMGWNIVTGLTVGMSKAQDPGLTDGGDATYLIAVLNRRNTEVAGVQLDLALPAGTTFVSAAGGCTSLPCSLGTVAANSVVGVVVTVKAPSPTVFPFAVTANLTAPGTGAADNLTATISASKATVASGGGCTTGGVPVAVVALLVVAAAVRARRRPRIELSD
jgi:uncharacterized repeat protein (TIGR01451 family)